MWYIKDNKLYVKIIYGYIVKKEEEYIDYEFDDETKKKIIEEYNKRIIDEANSEIDLWCNNDFTFINIENEMLVYKKNVKKINIMNIELFYESIFGDVRYDGWFEGDLELMRIDDKIIEIDF